MRIIVIAEIRCNFGIIFFIIHLFWGALEARKLPSPTRFNRRHMARLQRAALILRRRRLRTPGRKRTPRELRNDGPHLPFRASRDFRKSISLGDLCTAALCPGATTAAPFVTSQFAGLGYIYTFVYTCERRGKKETKKESPWPLLLEANPSFARKGSFASLPLVGAVPPGLPTLEDSTLV